MFNLRNTYESLPSDEIEHRTRQADLFSSTMMRGSGPHHDPILTTFFSSMWAGALGPLGSVSIFGTSVSSILGSLTTAIVTTAFTPGIQRQS